MSDKEKYKLYTNYLTLYQLTQPLRHHHRVLDESNKRFLIVIHCNFMQYD